MIFILLSIAAHNIESAAAVGSAGRWLQALLYFRPGGAACQEG